jgi:hypothetical protein
MGVLNQLLQRASKFSQTALAISYNPNKNLKHMKYINID